MKQKRFRMRRSTFYGNRKMSDVCLYFDFSFVMFGLFFLSPAKAEGLWLSITILWSYSPCRALKQGLSLLNLVPFKLLENSTTGLMPCFMKLESLKVPKKMTSICSVENAKILMLIMKMKWISKCKLSGLIKWKSTKEPVKSRCRRRNKKMTSRN